MPGRRPLLIVIALLGLPFSACLHISAPPATITHHEQNKSTTKPAEDLRRDFAVLPRVPGTVVKTNPQSDKGTATAQKIPDPPELPSKSGGIYPTGNIPNLLPPLPQVSSPPEPPLLAAVRAYVEGRPERAIEVIRSMDKPNQDVVLAVLPVLARGATADLNNDPHTAAMLVEQLNMAAARLETRAALRIENVTFCKNVEGFGRYVPQPANEPYRPNSRVQLYLEVKNLGSRQSSENDYITHIHATVEVKDAHNKLVEQLVPGEAYRRVPIVHFDRRLVSRSPLRDFHVLYVFSAPPAPGVYTITVELRDASTGRTVQTQPVQFCVAGQ